MTVLRHLAKWRALLPQFIPFEFRKIHSSSELFDRPAWIHRYRHQLVAISGPRTVIVFQHNTFYSRLESPLSVLRSCCWARNLNPGTVEDKKNPLVQLDRWRGMMPARAHVLVRETKRNFQKMLRILPWDNLGYKISNDNIAVNAFDLRNGSLPCS